MTATSQAKNSKARADSAAPFVLASASPRRLDLLKQIGVSPQLVVPADIDETSTAGESPKAYAERMAREKAEAVAAGHPEAIILSADTVVSVGKRILPKAEDAGTARKCLALLSGRRHRVTSGIALALPTGKLQVKSVTSVVAFKRLTDVDIDQYLASGEWDGKAGGYAIQGLAARHIRFMSGSYSGIVGLPLAEVAGWLTAHAPHVLDAE